MPAEGGSGTPLWRKLGIHAGDALALVEAPAEFHVPDLPPGVVVTREPRGARRGPSSDVIVAFFARAAPLQATLTRLAPRIFPDGALWVAWPRRAAGHVSDLGDVIVRTTALELGLVDVKVAALAEDWSGLRFVWRKELRRIAPPGAPDSVAPRSPSRR